MEVDKGVREARAAIMQKRAREEDEFLEEHPEFAYTLAALTGTVLSCGQSEMSLETIELRKAFEHLCSCKRCEYNYDLAARRRLRDMSSLRT